jgi:hypothetical protein
VGLRFALRLSDGTDAGEAEYGYQPAAGDVIRIEGNVRMRVLAVVPAAVIEEFVDRPLYGVLEVEPM